MGRDSRRGRNCSVLTRHRLFRSLSLGLLRNGSWFPAEQVAAIRSSTPSFWRFGDANAIAPCPSVQFCGAAPADEIAAP